MRREQSIQRFAIVVCHKSGFMMLSTLSVVSLGLVLLVGTTNSERVVVADEHSTEDDSIERGQYFWVYPDTDCYPNDEIGYCGTPGNVSVDECKKACFANPNCGGFNLNGHLKRLGCADEMVQWADDPEHKAPIDPGHRATTLFALGLYPPRREYWWELPGYDCNPDHELGSCLVQGLGTRAQQDHCKKMCEENVFCEGFNLPNGHLKAAGCKDDIIYEPKWGNGTMRLYYRRGHPQTRDPKRTRIVVIDKYDCNPGQELGNCSQYLPPPYTVSQCEDACRRNPKCGGFNLPNGHLKTVDCIQEINPSNDTGMELFYLTYPLPTPEQMCDRALQEDCGQTSDRENCFNCVTADQGYLEKYCTFEEIFGFCDSKKM